MRAAAELGQRLDSPGVVAHLLRDGAPPEKKEMNWPVLDELNFHAVRPSSFSITRAVKVADSNDSMLAVSASPGISCRTTTWPRLARR